MKTQIDSSTFYYKIPFSKLEIDHEIIAVGVGYPKENIPEHFFELLEEIKTKAAELCDVQAGYRLFEQVKISDDKKQLSISDTIFDTGKIINGQLRKADSAVLYVVTIGPELEKWANQLLAENDYLKGYIADAVASELAESASDVMHNDIQATFAENNLGSTNRFSPGYCNWNVSEQHKLFSLLPTNFCDIMLTPSSLMQPIKSTSGIIGIGKEAVRKGYQCNFCDMKDCVYRRKK